MSSDESIRTDASTVHRPTEQAEHVGPRSPSTMGSSEGSLEEAQTVIRGSSRAPAGTSTVDRTPTAVAQVLLGQRLNHFLLEELIGGGGMGAVFRARDEQLDRIVAIKVIPFVGDDVDLKRRFRNEAQSAAKLDHPHIARVFEVGSQDDWHYIVFEYVRGTNIRDKVAREGVFSVDDAVFVTCQLAEAIQHSADRGIVHRDIKPSNVLTGEDDQIKLVDMGLARSEHFEISEDMTASGVTLGTFDYISPEQARDPREADIRSDIYSLGCTLYFMLTGRPPFPGGTMLQKLLSHGNSPPPDARLLRTEVSDDLMAVIRKMLAKSPDDRYQNAMDLILDLRQIAQREGLSRSRSVAAIMVAEPNRLLVWLERHAPWLVAASLLLLSAGWLQLNAAISRDSFNIVVPEVPPVVEVADNRGDDAPSSSGESEPAASGDDQGDRVGAGDGGSEDRGTVDAEMSREPSDDASPSTDSISRRPLDSVPTEVPGPELPIRPPSTDGSQEADVVASDSSAIDAGEAYDESPGTIERIRVVGPDVSLDSEGQQAGVEVAETLSEAIQIARREDVERIEIAAPVIESEPVELGDRELTIVSSAAGGSTVVFRSEEILSMQRSTMFRIGSGQVTLENLNFVWSVPVAEVDGGALFALYPSGLVRMNHCTVTVENGSRREEVYAFDVITDPERIDPTRRDSSPSDPERVLPLVAIELSDVVVRGEISMVHMDFAAELQMRWSNGLLAVSRRMVDTAGALERPSEAAGPIQLSLDQLTASVPLGLVRMRLGVSGAYPVAIDRDATKCIFVVDQGLPHIEVTGLDSLEEERSLLSVRGESNAYDASPSLSDPFYTRTDMMGERVSTRLIDLLSDTDQPPSWWGERSPRWTVRWTKIELPNVAPSQLMPSDFRQDGILVSGFDEQDLPTPPTISRDPGAVQGEESLPPVVDFEGISNETGPGI